MVHCMRSILATTKTKTKEKKEKHFVVKYLQENKNQNFNNYFKAQTQRQEHVCDPSIQQTVESL